MEYRARSNTGPAQPEVEKEKEKKERSAKLQAPSAKRQA
jgi:hypothetical protein